MQTAVEMSMKRARAGLAASAFNAADIITMAAEGAVPFGRVVVDGTIPPQGKVPANSSDVFRGISVLTHAIESKQGTDPAGYPDEKDMNVMNFGAIWVQTMDTNLPTASAIYAKVGGGDDAGKLTLSSSGNIDLGAKLVLREVDIVNKLALVEFREKV